MRLLKIFLLLLLMAGSANAQVPKSDAELKAMLVGTWNSKDYNAKPVTYQKDGTTRIAGDVLMKWSVKDGVLDEIDTPETEGVPRDQWLGKSGGYWYNYLILFLNKHEMLLWDTKSKTFTFMYR